MAQPKTLSFGSFVTAVGDGGTPENFVTPCGFTQKSLEIKSETGDEVIPDCDNPDAPAWTSRDTKSLSVTVTGQGIMSMNALPLWQAWALSGTKKDLRVGPSTTALANNGGYFAGVGLLTSFKVDATLGERCKVSVNIESDGQWIWVPAAA